MANRKPTGRDVVRNLFVGSSVFTRDNCDPVSPAELAQAFNETTCLIDERQADDLFSRKLRGTVGSRATGVLHEAYASPITMPLVTPLTNRKYLTVNKPVRVITSNAALITAAGAPPPAAERDVAAPVLTALANATNFTMAPTRAGQAVHGIATTIPVFGYLIRVQWTLADLQTSLRLDFVSPAIAAQATIAPTSDECTEMWLFVPAASFAAPGGSGSTLVLNHSRTHGSPVVAKATVYTGAAPAASSGGWTVFVKEVDFTEELLDDVIPVFVNGKFA